MSERPGVAPGGGDDLDVSRRTRLAVERTWLAWWRTGLAVTVAALGVGRIAPHLLGVDHIPYVLLGIGYGVLALTIFAAGYLRYRATHMALLRGEYEELSIGWVALFAVAGVLLAVATLLLILLKG